MSLPDKSLVSEFSKKGGSSQSADQVFFGDENKETQSQRLFELVERNLQQQLELHQTKTVGYGQCIGLAIRSLEDGTEKSEDTKARLEDLLQSHQIGIVYANDLLKKGSRPCRLPYGKGRDIYLIPEIGWPASFSELIKAYQIMLTDLDKAQPITLNDAEVAVIFHYYLLMQQRNNWDLWHREVVRPLFRSFIDDNLPLGTELPNREITYTLADSPEHNGVVESKLSIDQKRELLLKYINLFLDARGHAISEKVISFRGYDHAEVLSTLDGVRRIWSGIRTYIKNENINVSPTVQAQMDSLLSDIDRISKKFIPDEEIAVEYSII